jgi:two-component system, cell cycle sensor histidine kinase and response regulator CckA
MNGQVLADQVLTLRPDIKCLFISGYTNDLLSDRIGIGDGAHFLQKPFSMKALATKVREVLKS